MPQTPVPDYGSLAGTMNPAGVFSLIQAAGAQQAEELARRTQAATQAAGQAQQQYEQAAAAPPPDMGQQALIPQLFGNIASVIAENPMYSQQAERSVAQQKADAMRARAENLQALQDIYRQRADEAQKAGDLETALNSRTKLESLDKVREQVNTNVARADAKAQAEAQRQNALKTAQIGQGVNPGGLPYGKAGDLLPYVDKSTFGMGAGGGAGSEPPVGTVITIDGPDGEPVQLYDTEGAIGNVKNAGLLWAKNNNVRVIDKDGLKVIQDIQGARDNVTDNLMQVMELLPKTPQERLMRYGELKLGAAAQFLPSQSAYRAWRTAAIRNLRATAGSGGLRINQKEIDLAVANDIPQITDTQEVALQKMTNIRIMLDNAFRPYVSKDWRRASRTIKFGVYPPLPTKGTVPMMNPDGTRYDVPVKEFKQRITLGWARVLSPPPPREPSQQAGGRGGSVNVRMSTQSPVYPPGNPAGQADSLDSALQKRGL